MTRGWHIIRCLGQVKADRRLNAVDFTVAHQLAERTNKAEFEKSGRLVTWQGVETLAAGTGLSERTVQRSVRRLQDYGHVSITPGGGRHRSNLYELILLARAETTTKTPSESHPLATRNPDFQYQKPRLSVPKTPSESHPNYLLTTNRTSATTTETEPGVPRQRADALGPPSGEETSKGLGNGHAVAAEPEPLGPLDQALADLRHQLGEKAKWLVMTRVAGLADAVVTLQVMTEAERDNITRHCQAEILAVTGATKLEFQFAIAVEPPPLRRMP